MIEINIFRKNHLNKILKEKNITTEDFKLLESPKYQLSSEKDVADLKENLLQLIDKINIENLTDLILSSLQIILSDQEKNNYKYKANKEIFITIYKAIEFINESDDYPDLFNQINLKILQENYSSFLKQECSNANPKQLTQIKKYLIWITSRRISDQKSKKIDVEEIKNEVKSLFPTLFVQQIEVRDRN